MIYVRSYVALLLTTVWSVAFLTVILGSRDTALLQVVSAPLFLLVGGLIGLDFRKAVKNGKGTHDA